MGEPLQLMPTNFWYRLPHKKVALLLLNSMVSSCVCRNGVFIRCIFLDPVSESSHGWPLVLQLQDLSSWSLVIGGVYSCD